MKKTFTILAASALAGAALAVDSPYSTEIVQFTNVDSGLSETQVTKMKAYGITTTDGVYLNSEQIGESGVYLTLSGSASTTYATAYTTGSWGNDKAVSMLNQDLGTSLTATNILNAKFVNTGGGSTNLSNLTVSFGTTSVYHAGDSVVMYLAVSGNVTNPTSLTVTEGLSNVSVSYAQSGGSGFAETISTAAEKDLILVRIAGNLTGDADAIDNVVFTLNGGSKVGYGMFAIVPEPATATLSLLALAGLAARRRRK